MTVAEEEKLRSIEGDVLECLDSGGLTERHYWSIRVKEGVRYIRFGCESDLLSVSANRVIEMSTSELLTMVRKAF